MYSIPQIKAVFKAKGYHYYDSGAYNLNIIGVRSENSKSNEFDDVMIVTYNSDRRKDLLDWWHITTDPGKKFLLNPLSGTGGTLIMVPGQYKSVYEIGIHGRSKPKEKQYEALEQCRTIKYVRDRNLDMKLDFSLYRDKDSIKNLIWGNFKSNIHRGNSGWLSKLRGTHLVDGHSAGCQVFQYADEFEQFMKLCKTSAGIWGNSFSYTLLEERDFSSIIKSTSSSIK
jgi:hypothetical protein